jgi:hypothetical protein
MCLGQVEQEILLFSLWLIRDMILGILTCDDEGKPCMLLRLETRGFQSPRMNI